MAEDMIEERVATVEEITMTALCHWQPIFSSDTFKSEIIPLPSDFLAYVREDGMTIPQSLDSCKPAHEDDYAAAAEDDEWDTTEEDGEELKAPEFPGLQRQISDCIAKFGGAVFPRSNWSSAKDAEWIVGGGTPLKCTRVEEVFLLINASTRIAYEWSDWAEAQAPSLVLRKWYGLERSMEFRCFVLRGRLLGISQKHCTESYPFLEELKDTLLDTIAKFWNQKVRDGFALPSYTLDVYLQRRLSGSYRVFIVSFGVLGVPDESPCLYDWAELEALAADWSEQFVVELRLWTHDTQPITAADRSHNALPYDLRHADFEEILRTVRNATGAASE
eukprot:NODE_2080_length_1303_cov_30.531898_g1892_i0.p1 GENE.NODE_2080_length_1303_cov_30.531898_g1892_i0~~NODE_2080_length_1303_cov_30.531898_g1892_i0.p1  ORF type:complete len:368 (+),score=74.09 NODE_2080_length_1303_cov_30.531898_g1892_i0:108-1106(+)